MAKEVILMADVSGLGAEGEVVRVADGYARNYLMPQKLGAPVTDATRRQLERKRKDRDAKLVLEKAGAESLRAVVDKASVTITVKTGAEGKMYGSVTLTDILGVLKGQGVALAKHQLDMPEPIKELGVFNIPVKLHPEVQTTLKVWVVEE
ncbi:MAG: 50S ribosomal protein L9 [Lentisphaerota bacterium]